MNANVFLKSIGLCAMFMASGCDISTHPDVSGGGSSSRFKTESEDYTGAAQRLEGQDQGSKERGGMTLRVQNDLPIIRDGDGAIISQMFIETAWFRFPKKPGESDAPMHGKFAVPLPGRILAGQEAGFSISHAQVSALQDTPGVEFLELGIKTSVQVRSGMFSCWEHTPVAEIQKFTHPLVKIRVHKVHKTSYSCDISIEEAY